MKDLENEEANYLLWEFKREMKAKRKTPWKEIPHEDKVDIVGGGRAGFEARRKHGIKDRGSESR